MPKNNCTSQHSDHIFSSSLSLLLYGMCSSLDECFPEADEVMELATTIDSSNLVAWTIRGTRTLYIIPIHRIIHMYMYMYLIYVHVHVHVLSLESTLQYSIILLYMCAIHVHAYTIHTCTVHVCILLIDLLQNVCLLPHIHVHYNDQFNHCRSLLRVI